MSVVSRKGNFEILDYTPLMELRPRMPTLLEKLGLLGTQDVHFGSSTIAQVERVQEGEDGIQAKARGADRNFLGRETGIVRNFNIPFFPLDTKWTAKEIQDLKAWGAADEPMDASDRVERSMDRVVRSHNRMMQKALYQAIRGQSYSPGWTQGQYDYFTEFGVTQKAFTVAFQTATIDPRDTIEKEARRHIIDNAENGAEEYRIMALVGSDFFDALVGHPLVADAYNNYSSAQEPYRNRLGGDAIERIFTTKNITYVEDIYPNDSGIGALEAYFIPMGIEDMFQVHYAPADTLSYANTEAQDMYVFLMDDHHRYQAVETETSFIAVNTRPELVPKATGTVS